MPVALNHLIVYSRDQEKSAKFYADILGLRAPRRFSVFVQVNLANGVAMDFDQVEEPQRTHYAFLISEVEFDQIFGRIQERKLAYWADPGKSQAGRINRHDGGRGVYFEDLDGHLLEVITRPYGGDWRRRTRAPSPASPLKRERDRLGG